MAVSPCIPSVETSTYMERLNQTKSEQTANGECTVEQQLAAALIRQLSSSTSTSSNVAQSVSTSRISLAPGIISQFIPTLLFPTPHSTPAEPIHVGLSQAQQLVMLLANLANQGSTATDTLMRNHATVANNMNARTSEPQSSGTQNILHQLLCGADVSQVRNRSGLIESNSPAAMSTACPTLANNIIQSDDNVSGGSAKSHLSTVSQVVPDGACLVQSTPTAFQGQFLPLTQWITPFIQVPVSVPSHPVQISSLAQVDPAVTPTYRVLEQFVSLLSELQRSHVASDQDSKNEDEISANVQVHRPVLTSHLLQKPISSNIHSTVSDAASESSCLQDGPTDAHFSQNLAISNVKSSDTPCKETNGDSQDRVSPQGRPRCHSDAHIRVNYRHKLYRSHRPRSQSKVEQLTRPTSLKKEADPLSKELETSLFAQLVLNSDAPTSAITMDKLNAEMDVDNRNIWDTDVAQSTTSTVTSLRHHSNVACNAETRGRIFEWLREADLFVAEHCCDIPLGALLATAISPGRNRLEELCATHVTPSCSEPVPVTAKNAVAKSWHQLLLVALMENGFIPSSSTAAFPQNFGVPCNTSADIYSPQDRPPKAKRSFETELDDSLTDDRLLLSNLTSLITTARELQLNTVAYKSMKFCILAQNAYPHHFSTSFVEALSELESLLKETKSDKHLFVEVLKLLNRLHCFEPGALREFFSLASDSFVESTHSSASPVNSNRSSPSQLTTANGESSGKRKACHASLAHLAFGRDSSPIHMRSRAYTTNSFNKSARISGHDRRSSFWSKRREVSVKEK